MSRGARGGAAVLAAALLCGTLTLLPGGAAAVPGPDGGTGSPGTEAGTGTEAGAAGTDPVSLPAITQRLSDDTCRKASNRKVTGLPWPQALLRPDAVWPLSEGAGVTVAVVGSGVDDIAGLLGDRLMRTPRRFDAGPAEDCAGHGTFTAGLIAAARTPGTGFAGIAPRARILDVPVTDRRGNTTPELLAQGIRAAVGGGARVIAVVAVTGSDSPALRSAVRYAVAEGSVVIAPVSPDGEKDVAYPASLPQVLSVAATGPGGKASGQAPEGRVDLTAPGEAVTGSGPGGRGFFTASGPSCATALVAGTAALVLSRRPELSAQALVHRLRSTTSGPGEPVPDRIRGYGSVDPIAAVTAVLPEERRGAAAPRGRAAAPGVAMPPVPGPSAAGSACWVAAGSLAVLAGVAVAAAVVPRGRRRQWRPGNYRAPEAARGRGPDPSEGNGCDPTPR
ncbi:S8 family serine peptidase [Streptomyces luteolifulvus]|uniref:S8 family serine peptidase n=1 Tax=Streptomyces luteolifulvus TaxID=2615112 RepID=A0A6H9USW8_9ACTN|nr:S8 family serine peptidase [Streptomyces luteolifulvus]KAB1140917.1 S8 family serine peptidase [Streptomyces luteolifulvus]